MACQNTPTPQNPVKRVPREEITPGPWIEETFATDFGIAMTAAVKLPLCFNNSPSSSAFFLSNGVPVPVRGAARFV